MLRNVELRPLFLAAVVGLVAVLSAGCATETRIKATPDTPRPTWTMIPPEPSDGNRFYVGIGLADNALNEAEGRRLALTNAAELAAQSIATDVESVLTETEGREGPAHKGKNVGQKAMCLPGSGQKPRKSCGACSRKNTTTSGGRSGNPFWEGPSLATSTTS